MPTYAYRCKRCESEFERTHGMDEKPGRCPNCGSTRLKRLLYAVAGWLR